MSAGNKNKKQNITRTKKQKMVYLHEPQTYFN